MPATYLDSSAIVRLAVEEPESAALRRHLRRRRPLVASALARTEVLRALLPGGEPALEAGHRALAALELVRVDDRVLARAGTLPPAGLRSLDAIHLATVELLGGDVGAVVTYDTRMARAAEQLGHQVVAPA